jgi:hypothetical protein
MKPIKMLSLAALAALATMAFAGASSAMAESTALCTVDESTCAGGTLVTHVHETTLAGRPATLLNGVGNVTCDVLFLSTSVGGLASPQIIEGNFTYTNCLMGSTKCTVTEKNGPSWVEILKWASERADEWVQGEIQVKCGSFINCVYGLEPVSGSAWTVIGPLISFETNGEVFAGSKSLTKISGLLCPVEARLDITLTPLSATYIAG